MYRGYNWFCKQINTVIIFFCLFVSWKIDILLSPHNAAQLRSAEEDWCWWDWMSTLACTAHPELDIMLFISAITLVWVQHVQQNKWFRKSICSSSSSCSRVKDFFSSGECSGILWIESKATTHLHGVKAEGWNSYLFSPYLGRHYSVYFVLLMKDRDNMYGSVFIFGKKIKSLE